MIPSDSACKRLNDCSQIRPACRSQSQVNTSSPSVPVPQQYFEGTSPFVAPRICGESNVHQPSNCNQWPNFTGFLQHINYSIPPPFLPPALPGSGYSTYQIPSYSSHLDLPNSAPLPDILANQYNPSEEKQYHEKESAFADTSVLHCKRTDKRPLIQVHSFSEQLKTYYTFLMKLKNDLENLNSISSRLDSASWGYRIANLSSQRDSLKRLKRSINIDNTTLSLLKYKIKKRLKKRRTRRKRSLKEKKSVSKYEIASLHMQQLQQIVDQQKQVRICDHPRKRSQIVDVALCILQTLVQLFNCGSIVDGSKILAMYKNHNYREIERTIFDQIAFCRIADLSPKPAISKMEEQFKIEADFTLFSVRQKKSEANGQLQFLTALSKMHSARINATNAQNKPSLSDAVCGFNKIIDKLKSMWQRQIEEYLVEENGLKIMLKDLVLTAEDIDRLKMKETCGQWLKLLFGTTNLEKGSYFSNYHELIGIRRDWDKYVVDEETNSSKIPAGWVVPKHPRGDAWSKFLT